MEAGVQPRVSAREAYPRRAEHNTVAVGGNRRWAEIAEWRSNRAGRGRTRRAQEARQGAPPDTQGKLYRTARLVPHNLAAAEARFGGRASRLARERVVEVPFAGAAHPPGPKRQRRLLAAHCSGSVAIAARGYVLRSGGGHRLGPHP